MGMRFGSKYRSPDRRSSEAPRLAVSRRFQPLPRGTWLPLLSIGVTLAVVAFVWALWRVPDLLHTHTAQDRYDARILVTTIAGGVVVSASLLYTALTYGLSVRGQIADRFSNALERLGSDELYVRMGGVHALEHVMRESLTQHNDVVEILTAFVRSRSPYSRWKKQEQSDTTKSPGDAPDTREGADVQAALTALARRPHRTERRPLDLSNTDLRGALLFEANLSGAVLDCSNLSGAFLTGADLSNASLADALLSGAVLNKSNPEPYITMLSSKILSADFTQDVLRETPKKKLAGANLSGADLNNIDLSQANLIGANLSGARLIGATLSGAKLKGSNLSGAHLSSLDLSGMDLSNVNMRDAKLDRVDLSDAIITNIDEDWSGADLSLATMSPGTQLPTGWRRDSRLGDRLVKVNNRDQTTPSPRRRWVLWRWLRKRILWF
jgi:uncharacterized protein YjbI with pentapeptide repeats